MVSVVIQRVSPFWHGKQRKESSSISKYFSREDEEKV